jgi:hypothetical protein
LLFFLSLYLTQRLVLTAPSCTTLHHLRTTVLLILSPRLGNYFCSGCGRVAYFKRTGNSKLIIFFTFNKQYWDELIAFSPLIRNGPHRKHASNIALCVFIVAVTFLPTFCLTTITDAQTDGREMGSSAMIYSYVRSFIKISSGVQKLMGGGGDTWTAW